MDLKPGDVIRIRIRAGRIILETDAVWLGQIDCSTNYVWVLSCYAPHYCWSSSNLDYIDAVKRLVPEANPADRRFKPVTGDVDILWKVSDAQKPAGPKYPHECPCGMRAALCEYHKDM